MSEIISKRKEARRPSHGLVPSVSAWGSLVRPVYTAGLLLEDEDLTSAVHYTRNLTRLMFRSLFGCGVICGLKVDAVPECKGRRLKVTVDCGLALDCEGNPLELRKPATLDFDPDCDEFPERFWVVLCYEETGCRTRDTACGCDGAQGSSHTRLRAGVRIELHSGELPDCVCHCEIAESDEASKDQRAVEPKSARRSRAEKTKPAKAGEDTGTAEAKAKERASCDCYKDHVDGVCPCCEHACCVLIGRIDLKLDSNGTVVLNREVGNGNVRYIRPVLLGMNDCVGGRRTGEQDSMPEKV